MCIVTITPTEPDAPTETATAPPPEAVPVKPLWRGRLHQVAFFFAVPAGVFLIAEATSVTARVAAIIYAIALAGMYGTSALYHRLPWSPNGRTWMKRLDHSMIFVLIAGTYTPLSLVVLHGGWRWAVLATVWGVAAIGIALKMFRIDGLKALGATLYIGLGWVVVIASPQLFGRLSWEATTLVITGGVLYTAGAIVLAAHRPDPSPKVFGYHEVWHSMVIGGSLCHYVAIFLVLLAR
jgi:hemolysin III